jgi:hypothetical protein
MKIIITSTNAATATAMTTHCASFSRCHGNDAPRKFQPTPSSVSKFLPYKRRRIHSITDGHKSTLPIQPLANNGPPNKNISGVQRFSEPSAKLAGYIRITDNELAIR